MVRLFKTMDHIWSIAVLLVLASGTIAISEHWGTDAGKYNETYSTIIVVVK